MPVQLFQLSDAVRREQDYWRLRVTVGTPGQIFELDSSVLALVVGPDSDFSKAALVYFDPTNPDPLFPSNIQQAVINVGSPFLGRIDALLTTELAATSSNARILVSAPEIFDVAAVPEAPVPTHANDLVQRVLPQLDLMAYLKEPPGFPTLRHDGYFQYVLNLPAGAGAGSGPSEHFLIPYYGRTGADVRIVNKSGLALEYDVYAVTFGIPSSGAGNNNAFTIITQGSAIASTVGSSVLTPVTLSQHGLFDFLLVSVRSPSGAALDPTLSANAVLTVRTHD